MKAQHLESLAEDMQDQILNYRNNLYTYRFKIKTLQAELQKLQEDLKQSRRKFDEICSLPEEEITADTFKIAV